jgi:hypothetical protein
MNILFTFFLSLLVQIKPIKVGTYYASQSGGSIEHWQLSGSIKSDSTITVDDIVSFEDGRYTFFLPIKEIVFTQPHTLVVKVSKKDITQLNSLPTGKYSILRIYPDERGIYNYPKVEIPTVELK